MNPTRGGWVIMLTIAFAMLLAVVHLPSEVPSWWGWLRPSWLVLVVFYWVMALPHRLGMISAWVTGLLVDVLYADPLGVNGFCLAALTYVTWSFYERFRMYSVAQQGAVVFLLVLGTEFIRMCAQHFGRDGALSWWILIPAVTSTVAWPFVAWALRRIRLQLAVE
ncbi:MAG TPA: rod shape-determining protein MreD [Pseudomonadales bacterium]|nr:rod shape-determining protein MreD [Pseudomonadales bacterium]